MKASIRDYGTADHTTHDLAIARAERDAWQSTCEELHRAIAGANVEIEAHLGRCEAADQRARSLDAALTAEREAGKGLVAQAEAVRADSRHHAAIAAQNATLASERDAAIAERDACAYDLRAIRDLVAPGNPQGTVVDAVRAMATGLIESIGARDAAEQARDMARDSRDAAIARAEAAERTLSGLYDDSKAELAKLRAELADLTVTRDRLLAREHEDGRLHAQLRAELAELRARPVLTVDMAERVISTYCDEFAATDREGRTDVWAEVDQARRDHAIGVMKSTIAKLGPVTLPAQDRAEELAATLVGTARASMTNVPIAWSCDFADGNENARRALTNVVRTALANLSPAPAPALDAAFLRRVLVATKHGPNGKGGPGPCDAACVKCEAERMAKAAPAREVAPTLVAVSDEELAREHEDGRLHAQLRAELAELRARPVLTEDLLRGALDAHGHAALTRKLFAHLGPVTLPSPDRAEELAAAFMNERAARGKFMTWAELTDADRAKMTDAARVALASLGAPPTSRDTVRDAMERAAERFGGPDGVFIGAGFSNALMHAAGLSGAVDGRLVRAILAGRCDVQDRGNGHYQIAPSPTSPPAARPVFAGVSEDELIRLFYVVGTDGIDHGEQCPPIDISDRNGIRAVLARLEVSLVTPVAPTLVAVSDEELATAYSVAHDQPIPRMAPLRDRTIAGIRAVRAKLGAAEVTEERVKAALCEHFKYEGHRDWSADARAILAYLRATAAKGG